MRGEGLVSGEMKMGECLQAWGERHPMLRARLMWGGAVEGRAMGAVLRGPPLGKVCSEGSRLVQRRQR